MIGLLPVGHPTESVTIVAVTGRRSPLSFQSFEQQFLVCLQERNRLPGLFLFKGHT